MHVLHIEHRAPDYETWKQAFDSDPLSRERAGVRTYRVLRAVDDPNYVLIDLYFDRLSEAEAMLGSLRGLWKRVQGTIIDATPEARIAEVAETGAY